MQQKAWNNSEDIFFMIIYIIRRIEGVLVPSLIDFLSIFLIPEEILHINLDFFSFSSPL